MAGDANWASVKTVAHYEGVNGSAAFTDATGKAWSAASGAALSDTRAKFGSGSMHGTGTSSAFVNTANNLSFAGDFTLECFVYLDANVATYNDVFKVGNEASGRFSFGLGNGSGSNRLYCNPFGESNLTFGTAAFGHDAWVHLCWMRSGSTFYGFIDGVLAGSATRSGTIGIASGGSMFAGSYMWVDDHRWSGCARYS